MVNLEESVIMSCEMKVRLRKFESIRKLLGIKAMLWLNGVEDLKGFRIKQLVSRGSLEGVEGIQLCSMQRETEKTFKPQGRFRNDNRDRKCPNKFNSEGITMKETMTLVKKEKAYSMHVTQHESSYTTFSKLEGVFVKDNLSRAEKRNLIKKHKPRKPSFMRIGDLKQGRNLHTHALTKGEVKMRWILIRKEELRGNVAHLSLSANFGWIIV
ncbi:hypothetical protein M9H77_35629 [Catharanthus roseus]|uniref:Uncharacterized protein n=1 Tax=Catharanthus roseus TaxID=4058 RepID=A0ACB9ZPJ9_CATRO|nr:hypothetical protein M9H77_35629 [Catharanthus roseus]